MHNKVLYFNNILDAIQKIEMYVKNVTMEEFERNSLVHDACLMQFQHIGEIANKLKSKFPEDNSLPYREIIGFRNFIAHEYLGIEIIDVWDTIQYDLPKLKKQIEEIK